MSLSAPLRGLLRAYLRHCPVTDGKGLLYRHLAPRLLPGHNPVSAVIPPGFTLRLDLDSATERELYFYGIYERHETRLLRRLVRAGDAVWDIGANLGYFTLLAATLVGKTGRVIAFEPFPPAWSRLQDNLALNHVPQVRAERVAVSDRAGSATLHYAALAADGEASLAPDAAQGSTLACTTVTLDGFRAAGGEPTPAFIKADVEGAEAAVLRGAAELLASPDAPLWLLEMEDAQLAQHHSSKAQVQALLAGYGYRAYALRRRRWAPADAVTARCRNIFWAQPANPRHAARLARAGITALP